MKRERKPSTALLPAPVVLVSVAGEDGAANVLTIAWAGTVCSAPPMLSVAVRPSRYSWRLLNAAREFVVNIPPADLVREVDLCGMWSGVEHDKFGELGLTAQPASKVAAPLITECPINLECVVRHQLDLGAHELFIAEIVAVHYDEELLDARGRLRSRAVSALTLVDGDYYTLGERVGSYGYAQKALRDKKKEEGVD